MSTYRVIMIRTVILICLSMSEIMLPDFTLSVPLYWPEWRTVFDIYCSFKCHCCDKSTAIVGAPATQLTKTNV